MRPSGWAGLLVFASHTETLSASTSQRTLSSAAAPQRQSQSCSLLHTGRRPFRLAYRIPALMRTTPIQSLQSTPLTDVSGSCLGPLDCRTAVCSWRLITAPLTTLARNGDPPAHLHHCILPHHDPSPGSTESPSRLTSAGPQVGSSPVHMFQLITSFGHWQATGPF